MKDEEIGQVAAAWIILIGIVFVGSFVGLTLAILKPILLYFGIDLKL
jgi:hypothetical protein